MPAFLGRLAIVLLALLPVHGALAAVGSIDSFGGNVRVASASGEVPAAAGLELQEGMTVITGADAWALLAMSDGASLTLRPNSRVKIDLYRYDAAGKAADNSGVLSLVQGAFRSITGLIGKTNPAG